MLSANPEDVFDTEALEFVGRQGAFEVSLVE